MLRRYLVIIEYQGGKVTRSDRTVEPDAFQGRLHDVLVLPGAVAGHAEAADVAQAEPVGGVGFDVQFDIEQGARAVPESRWGH